MANLFDVYNAGLLIDHTEGEKLETGETPITISGLTADTTYDKVQVAFAGSYNRSKVPSFKTNPGRNLLLGTNSNDKSSLNPGNGSYTTQYVAFDNGYKYTFSYTKASTNYAVYMFSGLEKNKFKPNTDYVLSFMANVTTDIAPRASFSNAAAKHNFVKQVTYPKILSSNGDQKVVIQLRTDPSIPDESDQSLYIDGFINKIGTFSIWDLKIETGKVATPWIPAPEDVS